MMAILLDIKYALRLLSKAPKFTALTLFVLVGGLSISLYTFSFLYTLVYKTLPIADGDSALTISLSMEGEGVGIPAYEFSRIRGDLTSFAELGIFSDVIMRLSMNDAGKDISVSFVESGVFEFSRVQPLLGRGIEAADLRAGATPVAVISFETWKNEYLGDPEVIGQSIRLNGKRMEIVGIMPDSYHFPLNTRVWLPMPESVSKVQAQSDRTVSVYMRIADAVSLEQASNELNTLLNAQYQNSVSLYDKEDGTLHAELVTFPVAQMGGQGTLIFTFFNIVALFILLLACINVGNLLLARSIARQKETAIRAALGAPSKRLISQLMWEGILITGLGGLLSILLVASALDYTDLVMRSFFGSGLVFWWHWGMDWPTAMMAVAFIVLTLFLACFLPAWRAANQDINAVLRDGTRGAQSKKAGSLSRWLITFQIFLIAVLMMIGTTTAFFTNNMVNLETGDQYQHVYRARMELPAGELESDEAVTAFYEDMLIRLQQENGVNHSGTRTYIGKIPVGLPDVRTTDANDMIEIDTMTVMGDTEFFGQRLMQGRVLDRRDRVGARKTALISRSMAKRHWPADDPIEQRIRLTIDGDTDWYTIVGVVSNRANASSIFGKLDAEDEVYVSALQVARRDQNVFYHSTMDAKSAVDTFYRVLFSKHGNFQPYDVSAAEKQLNQVKQAMGVMSNVTFLSGFFALLLALTGIYGMTANAVVQRTHEIGIRRAVGARDKDIVTLFIKQSGKMLVLGFGAALSFYVLVAISFNSITEGLVPWHLYPILAVSVVGILTVVVLTAVYLPTLRAVAMEPSAALRTE